MSVEHATVQVDGSVLPDPICIEESKGETVIIWRRASGVERFKITGLDPSQFTPPSSEGWVATFPCVDRNDVLGEFPYTVEVELPDGTRVIFNGDPPRIVNEPGTA